MQIEVLRLDSKGKSHLESQHEVAVLFGEISRQANIESVMACGEVPLKQTPFFPRSAIKPLQATLLGRLLREQRLVPLSAIQIACQCASHSGESQHTTAAMAILERFNLSAECLLCGTHIPYSAAAAQELVRHNQEPTALHNNCSGKHAGLLGAAQLLGCSPDDYIAWDHPLQSTLRDCLIDFFPVDLHHANWAIDGCSIPTYQMNIIQLWTGLARWSQQALHPGTVESEIARAFVQHPEMTSGKGEFPARLMALRPGELLVKVGAEGIYFAFFFGDRNSPPCTIAIKASDGTKRASEFALVWALAQIGVIEPLDWTLLYPGTKLAQRESLVFRNWAGLNAVEWRVREDSAQLSKVSL